MLSAIIISNVDDFVFLRANLKQIHDIFQQIIISIGNQRWNGEPEDTNAIVEFIQETQTQYPHVEFTRYNVPTDQYNLMKNMVTPEMYWEAHARWIAYEKLNKGTEYVLFLDSDEIIDGALFKKWLSTGQYKTTSAMKLKNYWYWREPTIRAKDYYEDSAVLAKVGSFNPMTIWSNLGRHDIYARNAGMKAREVDFNGEPIIHHYSWVRSKDGMLRKVKAWGHRSDRGDWTKMVEEEFSRPFNGTDFLKGLKYDIVENSFQIMI